MKRWRVGAQSKVLVTYTKGSFSGQRESDADMADLGSNLRVVRERLGLTQEQLGLRSNVHPTEVSRIESGKRDPRVSTVRKLAAALEVSPGRLLD